MPRVHLIPLACAAGGVGALGLVGLATPLSPAGWAAGIVYLLASTALLTTGLRRRRTARFGPANTVTAIRSTLVGLVAALVATATAHPIAVPLLAGVTALALALDGVDGWVARRTGTATGLGARFDMEVDAFLLLPLSVFDGRLLGWWVLAIGLMRYAFVAAGWLRPWMRAALPPRYWRKVVAASNGIALAIAATDLLPRWAAAALVAAALALLVESFGRDVVWLVRRRGETAPLAGDADYRRPHVPEHPLPSQLRSADDRR